MGIGGRAGIIPLYLIYTPVFIISLRGCGMREQSYDYTFPTVKSYSVLPALPLRHLLGIQYKKWRSCSLAVNLAISILEGLCSTLNSQLLSQMGRSSSFFYYFLPFPLIAI